MSVRVPGSDRKRRRPTGRRAAPATDAGWSELGGSEPVRPAVMPPRHRCPKCGRHEGVPLEFGYPTKEALAAAKRGDIVLGGCCVDFSKNTACRACGHQWHSAAPQGPGSGAARR